MKMLHVRTINKHLEVVVDGKEVILKLHPKNAQWLALQLMQQAMKISLGKVVPFKKKMGSEE